MSAPRLPIRVIVFDFDGTLVQSNQLKYYAYFSLFPDDPRTAGVIREVLADCFEASRYEILHFILEGLGMYGDLESEVAALSQRYNQLVLAATIACLEVDGAGASLAALALRFPLYISSNTPEESLQEIIRARGWAGYFKGIFGYPRQKDVTLREIMAQEQVGPSEVLMVGDGHSDRQAAEYTGCDFIYVPPGASLPALLRQALGEQLAISS